MSSNLRIGVGKVVYRGDMVRDQFSNVVLFEQTATTATSLVALKAAIWYACRKGNTASCSGAIQAFLQSELDDNDYTYVIIPAELWLAEWHSMFPPGTKLAVRLTKSLYGHPKAGRLAGPSRRSTEESWSTRNANVPIKLFNPMGDR